MLLSQLDMPSARYAFAFLAKGEICQKREGFISYRIGAQRQYIEFEQSENISSGRSSHIDRKKNKSKNKGFSPFYSCSFCLYKGLGLAHFAFVRTNAMLALSRVLEFSAKNLPHCTHGVCASRYARYRIRGMRTPRAIALGVGSEQEHKKRQISRGYLSFLVLLRRIELRTP